VPGPNTLWTLAQGERLSVGSPVTLTWDNDAGQLYTRTISVDENFMFKIDQSVTNTADTSISLAPYGIIARHGVPSDAQNFFILHEGMVAMNNGELIETKWDKIPDLDAVNGVPSERIEGVTNGWIGFTGHYFMTNLIPDPAQPTRLTVKFLPKTDIYQTEAVLPTQTWRQAKPQRCQPSCLPVPKSGKPCVNTRLRASTSLSIPSIGAGSFS